MTDYLAILAGAAVLLLLVSLYRLFGSDEFGRITNIPAEELTNRCRAIYKFLDAKIMPHALGFEKRMEAIGFTILDTELSVEGDVVKIRFDVSESSLIGKHDGINYPSDDVEAIGLGNCGLIRDEIRKFFGDDPEFGRVGTLNGETDYFTFILSNPSFGGDVKDLLDKSFFVEYERLKKNYADLEYGLLTGQSSDGLSFGRGY